MTLRLVLSRAGTAVSLWFRRYNKSTTSPQNFLPSSITNIRTLTGMPVDPAQLQVLHDEEKQEFYIDLKGKRALLQYNLQHGVYDLYHTFVPPELRGDGVARVLAETVFEFVLSTDGKMKLSCSYLDHMNKKNPSSKYADVVVD